MKLYKICIIIAVLISILSLSCCSRVDKNDVVLKTNNIENTDNSWNSIKFNGVLRVGIMPDMLPYIEKESENKYIGYLIDMMNAIAKRAEIDIEYVETNNQSIDYLLSNNKIDVILNGYTAADKENKAIKWLDSYMTSHQIIVCRKWSDTSSKEELIDSKIGVMENDHAYPQAQSDMKINNENLIKFDSQKKLINALDNCTVDAIIIDDAFFYYYRRSNTANYRILDEIVSSHVHQMGVRKENEQLANKLSETYNELINSGIIKELSEKWFKTELSNGILKK